MHAHTSTLHTHQVVASTWLGDHQGRPSAPTNSLYKLHMARYQVLHYITLHYIYARAIRLEKFQLNSILFVEEAQNIVGLTDKIVPSLDNVIAIN